MTKHNNYPNYNTTKAHMKNAYHHDPGNQTNLWAHGECFWPPLPPHLHVKRDFQWKTTPCGITTTLLLIPGGGGG